MKTIGLKLTDEQLIKKWRSYKKILSSNPFNLSLNEEILFRKAHDKYCHLNKRQRVFKIQIELGTYSTKLIYKKIKEYNIK